MTEKERIIALAVEINQKIDQLYLDFTDYLPHDDRQIKRLNRLRYKTKRLTRLLRRKSEEN